MRSTRQISLAQVLAEHDRYAQVEHALVDNLGDGFLLEHSPLCRRLRSGILDLGYRVTTRDRHGSLGWTLGSLRALLAHRELPYLDNVRVLRRELEESPGQVNLEDLLTVSPAGNRLAHESAHALAFQLFFDGKIAALAFDGALSQAARRDKVVRTHLCESFANASDMYAQIEPVHGAENLFVQLGLYRKLLPAPRSAWRRLRDAVGGPTTMALSMLAFLHANFLYKRTTATDRRRCLSLLDLRPRRGSALEAATAVLFERALDLNPRFRLLTSAIYFRQQGLTLGLHQALAFDFMQHLEDEPELLAQLRALSQLAAS